MWALVRGRNGGRLGMNLIGGSCLSVKKKGREGVRAVGGLKSCWAAWSPGVGPVGLLTPFFLKHFIFIFYFQQSFSINKGIWPN
jgi:hypothetical protein